MSKPYFAKWIPVEGEIKEGDWVIDPRGIPMTFFCFKSLNMIHNSPPRKAKLFLCSRDIKVGDKVVKLAGTPDEGKGTIVQLGETVVRLRLDDLDEESKPIIAGYQIKSIIKVIGKISPKATWVKENDEFDRNDILVHEWGGSSIRKPVEHAVITEESKILIKGPCGHFH